MISMPLTDDRIGELIAEEERIAQAGKWLKLQEQVYKEELDQAFVNMFMLGRCSIHIK